MKADLASGAYSPSTDIMFLDLAREWLTVKKSVRQKNTQIMYRNIIEKHLCFLEGIQLSNIRNSHFQLAINNASDHPRTCQQIYITFKQILKMAVSDGALGKGMYENICQDINLPKYTRTEKRPLTSVEKEAVLNCEFTDKEKAFISIIYSCGLRRGEALALTRFDLNFTAVPNTLSINKSLIFIGNDPEIKNLPKTDNGIRTIPLPTSTSAFLKEYICSLHGSNLFFSTYSSLMTKSSYRKM